MPTVTLLYFAALRERRGRASELVEAAPGETLADLYRRLFPPGAGGALPVAFARNQALVSPDDLPEEGDVVAFLPPVGGG